MKSGIGIKPITKSMMSSNDFKGECSTNSITWIQIQKSEDSMFKIGNKSSKTTLILEDGVRVPEDALTVAMNPKKKLFKEKASTKKSQAGTVARGCKMGETKQHDRVRSLFLDLGSLCDDISQNGKSSKVVLEDGVCVPEDVLTVAIKPKKNLF